MTAGYSGTPLAKKLGYKAGFAAAAVNSPGDYLSLVQPLPEGVTITDRPEPGCDLLHFFTNSRDELFRKRCS